MRTWLLVVALAVAAPASAQDAPADTNPWTLTLKLNGGPAALDREITLTSTGAATAINRRPEKTVMEQLPPDDALFLTGLARAYSPNELPQVTCTNCVRYDLQIHAGGNTFTSTISSRQLGASGAEALITALSRVLNRMLTAR